MALSGSVSTNTGMDGRYYKLSWTATQSIDNNTSTISWTLTAEGATSEWIMERRLYATIDGEYVYNSSVKVERWSGTIASGTKTIGHDNDGTKTFSITLGAAVYVSSVNCTGSQMFTLNVIARKSGLTIGGGSLGSAISITADRKSSNFTHTLQYECGSYNGTIATKTSATSWSFTPPLNWATGAPYGTKVYATFTLTTYNGNTSIGSNSKAVWLTIPDSVKPSCSLSISEPSGQSHVSTYGGYVQGQSKLHIVVNPTTSQGSPIKTYKTTANGSIYSTSSFDTAAIRNSGANTIKTTVTDGRGRSGTASQNITVIPYSNPIINRFSVARCDSDGTENASGSNVKVTYSYVITSLSNINSKSASLRYKKVSDFEWTTVSLTAAYSVTNATHIFAADDGSSYNVQLSVTDNFTSTIASTTVSTGFCLFHIPVSGKGITFGGVAEKDGFNVNMDAHFSKGITEDIKVSGGNCDEMLVSGTYYMSSSATNKPSYNGTARNGWLTVKAYGDASYVYQEYVSYTGNRYFRMRDNGTWGAWISCDSSTPNNKILWTASDPMYMNGSQTATLSERISVQKTGICITWCGYDGTSIREYDIVYTFVPKQHVTAFSGEGRGICCPLTVSTGNIYIGSKYLNVYDDKLVGSTYNAQNNDKFNNTHWVIKNVIGV